MADTIPTKNILTTCYVAAELVKANKSFCDNYKRSVIEQIDDVFVYVEDSSIWKKVDLLNFAEKFRGCAMSMSTLYLKVKKPQN